MGCSPTNRLLVTLRRSGLLKLLAGRDSNCRMKVGSVRLIVASSGTKRIRIALMSEFSTDLSPPAWNLDLTANRMERIPRSALAPKEDPKLEGHLVSRFCDELVKIPSGQLRRMLRSGCFQ